MAAFLYNLLLFICSPILFAYFLWRIFVVRKSNESWRENLGALPRLRDREPGRKLVWVHAASVGETVASLPVHEEIKRLCPDAMILHTTITQTGHAVALKSAKPAVQSRSISRRDLPAASAAIVAGWPSSALKRSSLKCSG